MPTLLASPTQASRHTTTTTALPAISCPALAPAQRRYSSIRATTHITTLPSRRLFSSTNLRLSASLTPGAESKAPAPTRGGSKLFPSADAAVADIQSGSTILSAGFGLCGVARTLITALHRRGKESLHSLTAVSNNAGVEGKGGLSVLTSEGQVDRLVLSYLGKNKVLEKKYLNGEISIELCPQGTLAERIRSAGSGIPAFFTATGARKSLPNS